MATGPDTTSLHQTAKSCLLYANDDPVELGKGLHPAPTQCRLWAPQCPCLAPHPPTHTTHHESLLGTGPVCVSCPHQGAEHCSWHADNLGNSLNPPAGSRVRPPTKSRTHTPRGTQAALWGLACPGKWMVGDLTLLTGPCAGGGRTQAPGGQCSGQTAFLS